MSLDTYPSEALDHLAQADQVLADLITQYGYVTRERSRPPFYALMSAIVSQQISVKAAQSVWETGLTTPANAVLAAIAAAIVLHRSATGDDRTG